MVEAARYVPARGDLVWIEFDPQAGREQAGRRPGLVLSEKIYNKASGLALVCPITTRQKGYPFELALPAGAKIGGVVLTDHVRSLDWQARRMKLIGRAPPGFADAAAQLVWRLIGAAGTEPG